MAQIESSKFCRFSGVISVLLWTGSLGLLTINLGARNTPNGCAVKQEYLGGYGAQTESAKDGQKKASLRWLFFALKFA
jgi:hypothetical protein